VDHDVVLDVGAVADQDLGLVGAQHRTEPHAGTGADLDVTDEDGRRLRYTRRDALSGASR